MKKKYFVLAALFLFNPIVSIFDILPDFIGYYFLLKAFTPVSYIFDNASDLHSSLKRMMIVGVAKFFSVILLFLTDATMALVLSFTMFATTIQVFGYPALQTAAEVIGICGLRTVWLQFIYGKLVPATPEMLYLCYPVTIAVTALVNGSIAAALLLRYRKGKYKEKL